MKAKKNSISKLEVRNWIGYVKSDEIKKEEHQRK